MFIGKYKVQLADIRVGACREVWHLFAASKNQLSDSDCVLSKSKRAETMVSKMAIWAVALSGVLAVNLYGDRRALCWNHKEWEITVSCSHGFVIRLEGSEPF